MAELRVTELDYTQILQNLKTFLADQEEFSDYDFEASGLSVLLRLLAYNTHYNAVLTHLLANESFLDTAIKRSSVVSLAKMLGYTPRSYTSARAVVNVRVTQTSESTTLVLGKDVRFNTTINNRTFTFLPETEYVAEVDDGEFLFENVTLVEGTLANKTFLVTPDLVSGPLVLPADTIDLSTLEVSVRTSTSDTTIEAFSREDTVINVTDTDAVYWVEEGKDGRYLLRFGDDVIGKKLTAGNIVLTRYLVSSGSDANGARFFTLSGAIVNEANATVELVTKSSAGSEKESIDSIRFNAPKFNTTRNRAVTAEDYRSLILAGYDKARDVAVWGGEENSPPIYGRVFITIDPKDGYVVSSGDKNFIVNNILKPRSVLTVQHEFVDPEYIYLGFDVEVLYNPKLTTLSASELSGVVRQEIERIFADDITTLNQSFYYSEFVEKLKDTSQSIIGVLSNMHIQRRSEVQTNVPIHKHLYFLSALRPTEIRSTVFETALDGFGTRNAYLQDFPHTTTSTHDIYELTEAVTGSLSLVESGTNQILLADAGHVNYATGEVVAENFVITQFLSALEELRISATPKDLHKNIFSRIIPTSDEEEAATVPTPSKNLIVRLNDSSANSTIRLRSGVTVTSIPRVS